MIKYKKTKKYSSFLYNRDIFIYHLNNLNLNVRSTCILINNYYYIFIAKLEIESR